MFIEEIEENDWNIKPNDNNDYRKYKSIESYHLHNWYDKLNEITFNTYIYESIDDIPEVLPFKKCMIRYENKSPKDSEFWGPVEKKEELIKQISNHDNDNLISLENNIIYKIINVVIKYYDNHKLDSDLSITSIDDTKSLIKALNEYNILFNDIDNKISSIGEEKNYIINHNNNNKVSIKNNIIEKIINKIIEVYNLHFKDDLLNKKLLIRLNNKVNQYFLNTLSNSEIDTNINHVNEKDTDVNHVNEKDTDNSIKNKLLNLISMRLASKQENIHEIKNYFFDLDKTVEKSENSENSSSQKSHDSSLEIFDDLISKTTSDLYSIKNNDQNLDYSDDYKLRNDKVSNSNSKHIYKTNLKNDINQKKKLLDRISNLLASKQDNTISIQTEYNKSQELKTSIFSEQEYDKNSIRRNESTILLKEIISNVNEKFEQKKQFDFDNNFYIRRQKELEKIINDRLLLEQCLIAEQIEKKKLEVENIEKQKLSEIEEVYLAKVEKDQRLLDYITKRNSLNKYKLDKLILINNISDKNDSNSQHQIIKNKLKSNKWKKNYNYIKNL